jgi:alpha-L-fucosidase
LGSDWTSDCQLGRKAGRQDASRLTDCGDGRKQHVPVAAPLQRITKVYSNEPETFLTRVAAMPLRGQQTQDTEAFSRTGSARKHAARSWFSDAGFGLGIAWGINSVLEVESGWGIYKDVGGKNGAWPIEKYLAQADVFNPTSYDPKLWMAAAAKAGFRYALFPTRSHDGYALWPSDYGHFSTKEHMGGRDLIRPYVEACRRCGLRVGFYYSPCNWLFNPPGWPYLGYPLRKSDFTYRRPERTLGTPRYVDATREELQGHFETLYAYVKGQVGELLTRYGKIDLLWWDGYDWPIGVDIHAAATDAWVRELQPELVTNDRYRLWAESPTLGDFSTEFENRSPDKSPGGAWEQCEAICGSWAYAGPSVACRSTAYIIERLARNRAWGGNYMADFGVRADGVLPPNFYRICDELAGWMKHSGESLNGTVPLKPIEQSDQPTTVSGDTWYVHLLGYQRKVTITGRPQPRQAIMLRTGAAATIELSEGRTVVTMPVGLRSDMDEVIAIRFA